jgi:hypothetical protein
VSVRVLERPGFRMRGVAPARSRNSEAELLRRNDLDALTWVGEQYAARVDQLEVLMDCGPRTVQRTVARLRDAGLVELRRVLVGEPAWIFPTSAGLRACGSNFGVWAPRIGLLSHVAAVNDVRLHVQDRSPGSEWICERSLARDRIGREHLPDGLALVDGQRVAIEVELTIKSRRRVTGILDELAGRYDAVVYFCAPGPHRLLGEFADSGRWPSLGIRDLPRRADDTSA